MTIIKCVIALWCSSFSSAFMLALHGLDLQVKKVSTMPLSVTMEESRRDFIRSAAAGIFAIGTTAQPVSAVMMSVDDPVIKLFNSGQALGKELAIERFMLARDDLNYLLKNYGEISAGGGDSVRRYLGTVGVTSGLYGITKVLKELQNEADDFVEYTENMNEFDAYLRQADTSCYSANFVEFSAAKTKPEKFLDDAKSDAEQMKKRLNAMAAELKL
eukprot:CAMPEP_0196809608 /NCGR_PEP_ID=MMETSP1362-20130617/9528_1 /TAXON_ID=163516 /ORGANISM="Leptocylindrus danicus, Strain CCMP1856" /LENGTH=215 /DNA_ID=CAMNT_0042184341 /DNA_START=1 /DNA_END=648 /DNA_ORIENTATION=-